MRFLIIAMLIVGVGIYLNRSYAYFYDYHGTYFLTSPKTGSDYLIVSNQKAQDYQLVVLGDSLTAGVGADKIEDSYPHLLADYISKQNRRVKLKNLAVPGINTIRILNDQVNTVPNFSDLVIILTGTNDIHNFVFPSEFESNLSQLIDKLQQKQIKKILLLTVPYLGSADTLFFPYDVLLTLRINYFNGIIERLSQQKKVNLIDLNGLTREIRNDPKYYAKDKFHPSTYGYQKWSEVIINASRDKIP